jgi:hypothetical protein
MIVERVEVRGECRWMLVVKVDGVAGVGRWMCAFGWDRVDDCGWVRCGWWMDGWWARKCIWCGSVDTVGAGGGCATTEVDGCGYRLSRRADVVRVDGCGASRGAWYE